MEKKESEVLRNRISENLDLFKVFFLIHWILRVTKLNNKILNLAQKLPRSPLLSEMFFLTAA